MGLLTSAKTAQTETKAGIRALEKKTRKRGATATGVKSTPDEPAAKAW